MLANERHGEEQEKDANRRTVTALHEQLIQTQLSLDDTKKKKDASERECSEKQSKLFDLQKDNKTLRLAKDDLAKKLHVQVRKGHISSNTRKQPPLKTFHMNLKWSRP